MKKLVLSFTILSALLFTSCSLFQDKLIPAAKKSASEKITSAIAKTGQCSAVEVIKADVDNLLKIESEDSMVVKAMTGDAPEGAQEQGVVSEICKAAAKLALPVLLQKGVPSKWECALTDLGSKVGQLADEACGKVSL